MWYRASIAEIPLLQGGCRISSAHAGGGGIAPNFFMLRHPRPHSAGYGGIAAIVLRQRAMRGRQDQRARERERERERDRKKKEKKEGERERERERLKTEKSKKKWLSVFYGQRLQAARTATSKRLQIRSGP